jgi:hypothetical protein
VKEEKVAILSYIPQIQPNEKGDLSLSYFIHQP